MPSDAAYGDCRTLGSRAWRDNPDAHGLIWTSVQDSGAHAILLFGDRLNPMHLDVISSRSVRTNPTALGDLETAGRRAGWTGTGQLGIRDPLRRRHFPLAGRNCPCGMPPPVSDRSILNYADVEPVGDQSHCPLVPDGSRRTGRSTGQGPFGKRAGTGNGQAVSPSNLAGQTGFLCAPLPGTKHAFQAAHEDVNSVSDDADENDAHDHDIGELEL